MHLIPTALGVLLFAAITTAVLCAFRVPDRCAPRQSTLSFARLAVRDGLIPSVDKTKTTGLVVLPGAFIGAIFGGVSPLEAGRFQIVVLAAIMAAGAVTSVTVAQWMGPVKTKPVAR